MEPIKRLVKKKLGELLIERGTITEAELAKALKTQEEKGGLIGEILVEQGFAKEEEIAQALTIQYGFPYLPLENYELNKKIVQLIPESTARKYNIIAIDKIGDTLTISMSNPLNEKVVEELEALTKCKIQVFVSTGKDVKKAINNLYGNPAR